MVCTQMVSFHSVRKLSRYREHPVFKYSVKRVFNIIFLDYLFGVSSHDTKQQATEKYGLIIDDLF